MIARALRYRLPLTCAALLAVCASPLRAQDPDSEPWAQPAEQDGGNGQNTPSVVPPPRQAPGAIPTPPDRNRTAPPRGAPNFVPPPPPSSITSQRVPGLPEGRQPPTTMRREQSNSNDPGRLAAEGLDLEATVGELVLTDMELPDVIALLQNFTNKPVLQQAGLSAQPINFNSQGPLTRGQAITVIESLLALNGVTVTRLGDDYLKAVPAVNANNHAPALLEDSTLDMQPTQQVYSKVFNLDYLSPAEAVSAVTNFMSGLVGGSPVVAFDKNSTLLVTDSLVNLQRIESLLARIDKPAPLNSEMLFFQLKNVTSRDAQQRLERLQNGPLGQRLQGNTAFDADDRTNQLIVYTHRSNASLIRELIGKLDMDVDPLTRTEMFSIRHADATEVAAVIKEVITGQERARDQQQGSNQRVRTPQQQQQQPVTQATDGAGVQFSQYLTIVPDERTNTIVATGTQSDLRLMGQIIERLDALLPQVRIEVVITEVELSDGEASGLESFGIQYSRLSDAPEGSLYPVGSDASDIGNRGLNNGSKDVWLSPGFRTGTGLSIDPFALENFTINTVFSVAKTHSNVHVLSAPNIVTTHNREASILVGTREPLVTTAVTNTSNNNDIVANIEYADVGLELTVKPLIGSNGVIQLEIEQKVDQVQEMVTLAGLGQQPRIATRQANSFVSVQSGQMVVLGGLQRVSDNEVHDKVFLLGDIPIIGQLFQPRENRTLRTELLIFIRPVVLPDAAASHADAVKQISELQEFERVNRYIETGSIRPEEEAEPENTGTRKILQRGKWVEVPAE